MPAGFVGARSLDFLDLQPAGLSASSRVRPSMFFRVRCIGFNVELLLKNGAPRAVGGMLGWNPGRLGSCALSLA